MHVTGLVERPADVGTGTRRILLMINGRVVRDHGIVRAAEAAYRSTLPAGVRPSLVLRLHLPGDAVDVNVHPAKAEVRLRERWPVERAVEAAVRRALGLLDASAGLGWRTWTPAPVPDWRQDVHTLEPEALRQRATLDGLFAGGSSSDDAPTARDEASIASMVDSPSVGLATSAVTDLHVPPLLQLRRMY